MIVCSAGLRMESHLLFASDRSGSSGIWALPMREGTPQGEPS